MTDFKPPADARSAERVIRCAPRWAWEVIDDILRPEYTWPGGGAEAAREAMCDGCDELDERNYFPSDFRRKREGVDCDWIRVQEPQGFPWSFAPVSLLALGVALGALASTALHLLL